MAYQPARPILNSGYANVKFTGPDSDQRGWNMLAQNYLAQVEKKYQETNDFYDLQREEMDNLSKVLEGTAGADFQYLNNKVVETRNAFKDIFKGLSKKDYNQQDVQDRIFAAKNELLKAKQLSTTSLEQIKQAYALSKGDHMKEAEFQKELTRQLSLPPDQRDPDLLNKVQTDPLFFNGYDYLTSFLDARKTTTEPIQRKDDNFFYSYDATYRPELGHFNKDGEWVFDPQEHVVEDALKHPQFYNTILGMMDPSLVKSLTDTGNKGQLKKAVKEQAKQYMNEVFIREEDGKRVGVYDPKLVQKGRTLNPAKYARPTTYDKNKAAFDQEAEAIQQRLLSDNPQSFDEYLSPDGWRGFSFEYDENGNISKIIGEMVDKSSIFYGKGLGETPTTTEEIPVNIHDPGSVKQALSRIKYVWSKDKGKVMAKPMSKPTSTSKPKIEGF